MGDRKLPFETCIPLTIDQEGRLIDWIKERTRQIADDMGRDEDGTAGSVSFDGVKTFIDSWVGRRKKYRKQSRGKFGYRAQLDNQIYKESNLSPNRVRSWTNRRQARAYRYLFGADPWFEAKPANPFAMGDNRVAEVIMGHARKYASKHRGIVRSLKEAKDIALDLGECVTKIAIIPKRRRWKSKTSVMLAGDGTTGEPLLDSNGQPIFPDDQWLPTEVAADDGSKTVQMVLERDTTVVRPERAFWGAIREYEREVTEFVPIAKNIEVGDFLIATTAEDVQSADLVAHLYSDSLNSVADNLGRWDLVPLDPGQEEESLGIAEDIGPHLFSFKDAKPLPQARTPAPGSGSGHPQEGDADQEMGEQHSRSEAVKPSLGRGNPDLSICETYCFFDVDEDGRDEHMLVIWERHSGKILFYDYAENHIIDGRFRPFAVTRVRPIAGRWYGMGDYEAWENLQEIIELQTNRVNMSASVSGGVTEVDWSVVTNGAVDKRNVVLTPGKVYERDPAAPPDKPFVRRTPLVEQNPSMDKMLEMFLQLGENESGVTDPGAGEMAGLPQTQLATGIKAVINAGLELFAPTIDDLKTGIEGVLTLIVKAIHSQPPRSEFSNRLRTEMAAVVREKPELEGIDLDAIRHFDAEVVLLLTQQKSDEQQQAFVTAWNMIVQFVQMPPDVRAAMKPLMMAYLKMLDLDGIEDAMDMLVPEGGGGPVMEPLEPQGSMAKLTG